MTHVIAATRARISGKAGRADDALHFGALHACSGSFANDVRTEISAAARTINTINKARLSRPCHARSLFAVSHTAHKRRVLVTLPLLFLHFAAIFLNFASGSTWQNGAAALARAPQGLLLQAHLSGARQVTFPKSGVSGGGFADLQTWREKTPLLPLRRGICSCVYRQPRVRREGLVACAR